MNCYNGFRLTAVILLVIFISGCSTVYGRQNDRQNVFFDSNVPGTLVQCGSESIVTPGNLALRQSKSHTCSASKEGYEPERVRIVSGISKQGFRHSTDTNKEKWGIWTLGIGMLVGWSVDFVSGAMRDLETDQVILELKPEGSTGTVKHIFNKAIDTGKTIVNVPRDLAAGTTTTALDSTVHSGASQLGVVSSEKRKDTEDIIEGKKIAERMEFFSS